MRKYSAIRNIMIFSKNCEKSAQFYVDVLGLKVNQMSPEYSELLDENNVKLVIKYTNSEAHTRIGYSPLITFNVPQFDTIMERLKNYSVEFDGEPNTNSSVGKIACFKSPDGLMIGILESNSTLDDEEIQFDSGFSGDKLDANSSEIKNLLDKFKI